MRHIVKGRTVIVIAHRLAAVRHCRPHRRHGRTAASSRIGTHDELLAAPGEASMPASGRMQLEGAAVA